MKPQIQTTTKLQTLNSILEENGRIIIAGPCSAESQEQVIETAKALAADGRVHFLRAGIWKPRTSPGSFEGVGKEGFKWLNQAKAITGLPIATEVGSERHVYEALKHGVDLLWIGARTVSNPFTVQEIADAIRGIDIPVLVKNPLCPDIDLWEGAINRFVRSGLSQVGAVHRGFSQQNKTVLRNNPNWSIPEMLRERMPNIPIICDPSHIAGNQNLVPIIAQRAMDDGYSGLMVEVHPNPKQALSDSAQQLLPSDFATMLDKLFNLRSSHNSDDLLSELRLEVDLLDEQLVNALSSRMKLAKQIAQVKQKNSIDIIQNTRWELVMQKVLKLAHEKGLKTTFIRKLFDSIHKESCSFQQEQMVQGAIK
jgi:chorismate mutase